MLPISLASALPDVLPPELGLPSTDLPAPPACSGLIWASKGSQSPLSELGNEFSAQPVKLHIVIGVLLKNIIFDVLFLCGGLGKCRSVCSPFYFTVA